MRLTKWGGNLDGMQLEGRLQPALSTLGMPLWSLVEQRQPKRLIDPVRLAPVVPHHH